MKSSMLIALFAGVLAFSALGDEVVLKNGRTIKGTVVNDTETEVVLRLPDGNRLRFARKLIKEVRSTPTPPAAEPQPELAPPTPIKLRWGMQPGKEVRYRTRYRYETLIVGSEEASSFEEWKNDMTLRCAGTRVGELEMVVTLNRAQHTRHNEKGDSSTDTEHEDPAKRGDTNMIGQPITFRLSRRGEVLELVSFGPMRFADIEDVKGRREMEKAIGEYILRTHLFGLLGTFPEESILPGKASWEEVMVISGADPGDMTLKIVNSLASSTAREFTISQGGGLALHGMNARLLESSKTTGTVNFSRTAGHLTRIRQRTESVLNYDVNGKQVPARMVISLDVDTGD